MIDRSIYAPGTALVVDTNGGTDIELVAAVSGKAIVVDYLLVSVSAAATNIFLESSTTTKIFPDLFLAANSTWDTEDPYIRTAAGESLTFSATITGTISVFVRYHLESN